MAAPTCLYSQVCLSECNNLVAQNPQTADAKKARDYLLKQHPTWRVPERRVKKFVKKQAKSDLKTATSVDGAGVPDDDQSVSSVTRRVKSMVKKIFVFKKLAAGGAGGKLSPTSAAAASAHTADPEAPMKEIHTSSLLLSPSADSVESADPQVLPPTPEKQKVEAVEGAVEDEAEQEEKGLPLDEAVVYKDDNDGKKGGCCAPCEGCIVM